MIFTTSQSERRPSRHEQRERGCILCQTHGRMFKQMRQKSEHSSPPPPVPHRRRPAGASTPPPSAAAACARHHVWFFCFVFFLAAGVGFNRHILTLLLLTSICNLSQRDQIIFSGDRGPLRHSPMTFRLKSPSGSFFGARGECAFQEERERDWCHISC